MSGLKRESDQPKVFFVLNANRLNLESVIRSLELRSPAYQISVYRYIHVGNNREEGSMVGIERW